MYCTVYSNVFIERVCLPKHFPKYTLCSITTVSTFRYISLVKLLSSQLKTICWIRTELKTNFGH